MKSKTKKYLRSIIKLVLFLIILVNSYKIGEKQYQYLSSDYVYRQIRREKDQAPTVPNYLYSKDYDWIQVTNTKIDYPIMKTNDNGYYLNHNYKNNYDISGAIYYDASDEPYNRNLTVIYGHAMRNGSMFKSLHYLRDDHDKFLDSKLYIYTKECKTTYKPLGYKIYSATDMSYRMIEYMNEYQIKDYLIKECNFYTNAEIIENKHIIGLVTCEYSINNGRIIMFYIKE